MIFSDFRGPGAHFGDLGAHFEDISDLCDFEDVPGAKKHVTVEVKMRPQTHLLQCCFFNVLLSAHFS